MTKQHTRLFDANIRNNVVRVTLVILTLTIHLGILEAFSPSFAISRIQHHHNVLLGSHSTVGKVEYGMLMSSMSDSEGDGGQVDVNSNKKMGPITAFRGTMRATTGLSLTALRATLRAATGVSVSGILRAIVEPLPLWLRAFMQPFLIIYYTPLMILRSMIGTSNTSRKEDRLAHEHFVEGLKEAVQVTEKVNEGGYWPVRISDDGGFVAVALPDPEKVLEPINMLEAIADSVEVAASTSIIDSQIVDE